MSESEIAIGNPWNQSMTINTRVFETVDANAKPSLKSLGFQNVVNTVIPGKQ